MNLLPAAQQTVFFLDGNPIGYEIQRSGEVFRLIPHRISDPARAAPEITAAHSRGQWLLEPVLDRDLADQVIEDLERCLARRPF